MTISEYINREKDKMKDKSWKERLAYFWDYYKWYILIGLFALVLIGQTVVTKCNQKDAVMKGILIDAVEPLEAPAIVQTFYANNGVDPSKEEIVLDTGFSLNSDLPDVVSTSYKMIHARVGAQDTDFVMGYEYAIQRLAYDSSRMFADLREVISAETLARLEGHIYYIDSSVLETIKKSPTEAIPIPDPQKPENMVDPVPVAVDVSACREFISAYYDSDQTIYISVVTNSPHREFATRFVELLLS